MSARGQHTPVFDPSTNCIDAGELEDEETLE
jgi:hypothetical protein